MEYCLPLLHATTLALLLATQLYCLPAGQGHDYLAALESSHVPADSNAQQLQHQSQVYPLDTFLSLQNSNEVGVPIHPFQLLDYPAHQAASLTEDRPRARQIILNSLARQVGPGSQYGSRSDHLVGEPVTPMQQSIPQGAFRSYQVATQEQNSLHQEQPQQQRLGSSIYSSIDLGNHGEPTATRQFIPFLRLTIPPEGMYLRQPTEQSHSHHVSHSSAHLNGHNQHHHTQAYLDHAPRGTLDSMNHWSQSSRNENLMSASGQDQHQPPTIPQRPGPIYSIDHGCQAWKSTLTQETVDQIYRHISELWLNLTPGQVSDALRLVDHKLSNNAILLFKIKLGYPPAFYEVAQACGPVAPLVEEAFAPPPCLSTFVPSGKSLLARYPWQTMMDIDKVAVIHEMIVFRLRPANVNEARNRIRSANKFLHNNPSVALRLASFDVDAFDTVIEYVNTVKRT